MNDDELVTQRLKKTFSSVGIAWECTNGMGRAYEFARSGQFQVIFTAPYNGSWRRLVEMASDHDLSFVVVLVARSFDLNEWGESLEDGAFDVLDALQELPQAAEVANRAFLAAFLKGAAVLPPSVHTPAA